VSLARKALLQASKSDFLNRQATQRAFVKRAVRKFMPGEKPDEALAAGEGLAKSGRGIVYTKLGEALTDVREADAVRDHYLDFYDQIAKRGLRAHVSVKPTQLALDLDADRCLAHCFALAAKAEATGSYLWLDMEDSSYVERTLALYEALKAKHPRTGIAIQAYLRRTPADIQRLLPLSPVIRLVKGAYAEPESVAFPIKADTDAAYEALAQTMLEAASAGRCLPIFGTHDIPLIRRILARAESLRLAKDAYEIHMLYGIRESDQVRLRNEGQVVKTLISYGSSWYRWYMRRLAERPANVWFVVRSMLPS
jgi:proline dehydrogenase